MPDCFPLIRSCRFFIVAGFLLATGIVLEVRAAEVTISLDAEADLTSYFVTNWSDGIAQLNLTYPGTTRQPFWNTNNLSQTYNGSFDFFPNDSAMKFGELTYDDSNLIAGSGSATITGLTLGIERDPLDPNYVNGTWLSFTTVLETYSGTISVLNGAVAAINLTASYTSTGNFGLTPIDGSGTFTIVDDQFQVSASAYNSSLGSDNPSAEWVWTGTILAVGAQSSPGDFDLDGDVDGRDFLLWQRSPSLGHLADWQANYGTGSSLLSAVPEPSGLAIVLSVVGALLKRHA
jgi:hypothetical protein